MNNTQRKLIGALALLPMLLPATGLGYNYPPPMPPGYNPNQFRPLPPSNVRGTPPVSPQTYQSPPYGYGQQQTALRPRLELVIKDATPYVQENTLLTLRIISGANLSRIDPLLPQDQSVMFHKIKEPTAYTRNVNGQRQIVNEIMYLVTPLQSGELEVGIQVEVETANNGYASQTMTLDADQPLKLEVRPPHPDVKPWLPLEQLALTSNINAPMEVEEGKPVSLVLKLNAAGATGGQLPSLERLLQSPDFRVYREKTETEGGLSKNGRHIMGIRTEHYTLVPQYGGALRMPSARLTWFNVSTGTVEHSSLPIKTVHAAGAAGSLDRFFGTGAGGSSMFPSGYASAFWLPLLGVLLLLTGYWAGVWLKGRKDGGRPSPLAPLGKAARSTAAGARARTNRVVTRLNPLRYWHRVMARAAGILPTSVRFWFWVRCANDETDPGLWFKTLQFLSCRQLALSPHAPLPKMAERVIECQPSANSDKVRKLFEQLEGALYGHDSIDFEHWKKQLKRKVRPGIGWFRSKPCGKTGTEAMRLPALNPKTAA